MTLPEVMERMLRTKRKEMKRCAGALRWSQVDEIYQCFVWQFIGEKR